MKSISDNNVIKFKNISKKGKDGGSIFANFQVKGIKNGVVISSSISVDISDLELTTSDTLEKIIEKSVKKGLAEFKRIDFSLEEISKKTVSLGVAQLG